MTAKLSGIYINVSYSNTGRKLAGSVNFSVEGGTVSHHVDDQLSEELHAVLMASYNRIAKKAITALQESTQPVIEHSDDKRLSDYKPAADIDTIPF